MFWQVVDLGPGACPDAPSHQPLRSCGLRLWFSDESKNPDSPLSPSLPFRFCGSVRISKKIRVSGKSLVKRKLVWITLIYPLVLFLTPVLIFRLEI